MKIVKTAGKPPAKSLAVQLKEAEQLAELDRLRRAARFEAEQEEHTRNAWRTEAASATRTTERSVRLARASEVAHAVARRAVPYLPLVLVNTLAVRGQLGWGQDNLAGGIWIALLFAGALESIALFLQYFGNRALARRDSANALYLAAFAVAGVVAWINYSHYAGADMAPTTEAVAYALCSIVSPWLWRIHARAELRDVLKEAGEIDSRAVKLSMARKIYHPIKSFKVIRHAAWTGETNPARAIGAWEAARQARGPESASNGSGAPGVLPVKPLAIKRQALAGKPARAISTGGDHTQHPKYTEGVALYRQSMQGPGRPMSQRDLAKALDMANRVLAAQIIKDVNGEIGSRENHAAPAHS